MEETTATPNPESAPSTPEVLPTEIQTSDPDANKKKLIIAVIALVVVAILVGVTILMLSLEPATTSKIRDVFIIFMALESIIIGIVLTILIVQIATLINLIQNELKPLIKSTNETVNTIRGTSIFLSDNLTEPVIKLNEYLAGLKKFFDILKPGR